MNVVRRSQGWAIVYVTQGSAAITRVLAERHQMGMAP